MNQSHLYFITGISGSGKTTVARELIKRGYVALDSKVTKGIFHFADSGGWPASDFDRKIKTGRINTNGF